MYKVGDIVFNHYREGPWKIIHAEKRSMPSLTRYKLDNGDEIIGPVWREDIRSENSLDVMEDICTKWAIGSSTEIRNIP